MADVAPSVGGEGQPRQRTARIPNSERIESDGDQELDPLEQARREARFARHIALVALALAGIAFSAMAVSMTSARSSARQARMHQATVLDETYYPTVPGIPEMKVGWARCLTNAVVRQGHSASSPKVAVVRGTAKVYVAEVRGRRVRITEPVEGWISSVSSDGIEILRDLRSEALKREVLGSQRYEQLRQPRNMTVDQSLAQLKEELQKFKGVQGKLLDALDNTSKQLMDKTKVHQLADVASNGATKVVASVKDAVQNADLERFDPDKIAKDLMNGQVNLPGNIHLDLRNKKTVDQAGALAGQAIGNIVE